MADLLKNLYGASFFKQYCTALTTVIPSFDEDAFEKAVHTDEWEAMELKQRMKHLTQVTDQILPIKYTDKVATIIDIIGALRSQGVGDQNFIYTFLTDIIPLHGLQDIETSISAIEKITSFTSFEFAGRLFFVHHPDRMMNQMKIWARHTNPHVRRYASEGCRPRLPWGLQLKQFVLDPNPIIPVLELMMEDDSEYVRKSVANNLNDISKDHPEVVINLIKKWKDASKNTNWILKHGARTLLKSGHPEALSLFGTSTETPCTIQEFVLDKDKIQLDDEIKMTFSLQNDATEDAQFRLEYVIYFVKQRGQTSKKIFKISESQIAAKATKVMTKTHKFSDLSTRKHYTGLHTIALVVNGVQKDISTFHLEA